MARIATVYRRDRLEFRPVDMSYIRWLKISEALARRGHEVDIVTNEPRWEHDSKPIVMAQNLRRVPLARVNWNRYDVVKTLFHRGFETLEEYRGTCHPFIISKLGSVVGPTDLPGIYFYGAEREQLYATQERLCRRSHYITVLSRPAAEYLDECHGVGDRLLLVPGGVDSKIPEKGPDPYPGDKGVRCLFAGNIYTQDRQGEANRTLSEKLNTLGGFLAKRGIRLYFLGKGDVSLLDPHVVTDLGTVSYDESWSYMQHADVGIVVAAGPFMHNNESTKIYHYLRVGLPVVSEEGFPNDYVVRESNLGFVVPNGDLEHMARKIEEAAVIDSWDRKGAAEYVVREHSWDRRVQTYEDLIHNVSVGYSARNGTNA